MSHRQTGWLTVALQLSRAYHRAGILVGLLRFQANNRFHVRLLFQFFHIPDNYFVAIFFMMFLSTILWNIREKVSGFMVSLAARTPLAAGNVKRLQPVSFMRFSNIAHIRVVALCNVKSSISFYQTTQPLTHGAHNAETRLDGIFQEDVT